MKRTILSLVALAIIVLNGLSAPVVHAYSYTPDAYPSYNARFHPQNPNYYQGNLRLKLKKKADIERASAPNVHYDQYTNDYYRCNWQYNKNLGTWVCEQQSLKADTKPRDVLVCPYGYRLNNQETACVKDYSSATSPGAYWDCAGTAKPPVTSAPCATNGSSYAGYNANSSYTPQITTTREYVIEEVYYQDYKKSGKEKRPEEQGKKSDHKKPARLPQTGAGMNWALAMMALGGTGFMAIKRMKSVR